MMRRTPMKRGGTPMKRAAPLRTTKPMKKRRKPAAKRENREYADACRGEPCYLLVPGVQCAHQSTVVPCHSNQQAHGKGMGIKADDIYTVPGCLHCHFEIDQGKRLSREQRQDIWNRAYLCWVSVRSKKMSSAKSAITLAE